MLQSHILILSLAYCSIVFTDIYFVRVYVSLHNVTGISPTELCQFLETHILYLAYGADRSCLLFNCSCIKKKNLFLQFRYEILCCLIKSNFRYCKKQVRLRSMVHVFPLALEDVGQWCVQENEIQEAPLSLFSGYTDKAEDLAELWV